jgi:hypothetical protein
VPCSERNDMDNSSILDQIINSQKAEEVAKLDAVEIINNLFGELSVREKDVVIRRYGLHGSGKETLESIGLAHNLTRERIRQIETSSVKKLQRLNNLDNYISTLKKVILELLEEHGGLMEKEYLLDLLVDFSLNGINAKSGDQLIHKNFLNFMITKLLHKDFEEIVNSKYFKDFYKLKHQSIEHFEELAIEISTELKRLREILKTEEIIELAKKSSAFKKHEKKMTADNNIDISKVLNSDLYQENSDIINSNKSVYSLIRASKKIEQNKFGCWGVYNWREIKPKTINDKIYLILMNAKKPMHFVEIADKINNINFDGKSANAATVHNELILDEKYVLVGRGIYSLKEWGFQDGTVADVIIDILSSVKEPIDRDEIINKVLEKRLVKKATIILALMNKDKFEKLNGKYLLKSSKKVDSIS